MINIIVSILNRLKAKGVPRIPAGESCILSLQFNFNHKLIKNEKRN